MATLIKKTFIHGDLLTLSEVQFIIIMMDTIHDGSMEADVVLELRVLPLKGNRKSTGQYPEHRKPQRPSPQ